MPLYQVNAGDRILAADANQYYNILKGVAASGETVTLIYNAAAAFILQPSSDPSAGTEAMQIKNAGGTVQGSLTFDGKIKVADGTGVIPSLRFQSEATGLFLASAGVIGVAASGAAANVKVGATFVAIGATTAAGGAIRLQNVDGIFARNAGNSADIEMIRVSSGNLVTIDNPGNGVQVGGALKLLTIAGFAASDKYLIVDSSGNVHKSAIGPAS